MNHRIAILPVIKTNLTLGCRVCKDGWSMQPELGGCVDIDECANGRHECTRNQFCVNNEGSFSCLGKKFSNIAIEYELICYVYDVRV